MRPISASEVGAYLFCARAWWYRRQGVKSNNQAELVAGLTWHQRHGRQTLLADLLRALAWLLVWVALILATIACVLEWL